MRIFFVQWCNAQFIFFGGAVCRFFLSARSRRGAVAVRAVARFLFVRVSFAKTQKRFAFVRGSVRAFFQKGAGGVHSYTRRARCFFAFRLCVSARACACALSNCVLFFGNFQIKNRAKKAGRVFYFFAKKV